MSKSETIVIFLLMQLLLITELNGNIISRYQRRHRRQTSGALYGMNANMGASAPAGFNYPSNTNIQGTRLNNADAKDMYGNLFGSMSNAEGNLNSVNLYALPRPQQQQLYGTNDQAQLNALYSGSGYYSPYAPIAGSQAIPSSNTQLAYPANTNQVLTHKDYQGGLSNTPGSHNNNNNNKNHNNQFSYNNDLLPNRNPYGGSMDMNPNRNGWPTGTNANNNNNNNNAYLLNNDLSPNRNPFGGPMNTNVNKNPWLDASNNELSPNRNSFGGSMDTNLNKNIWPTGNNNPYLPNNDLSPNRNIFGSSMDNSFNKNSWSNTNSVNRYHQNPGNSYYPGKDQGSIHNPNRYGSSYSYDFNHSYQLQLSYLIMFISMIVILI